MASDSGKMCTSLSSLLALVTSHAFVRSDVRPADHFYIFTTMPAF